MKTLTLNAMKKTFAALVIGAMVALNAGCSGSKDYKTVTINGAGGTVAKFCENGARLMELKVPDRNGKLVDVVVGFQDPADYDLSTEPYYGATIGRYGNRIAKGKFTLDGKSYQLTINNGVNTLHGGKTGFQYQNWRLEKESDSVLVCKLSAPNGENGFPGKLSVKVTYTLTRNNELAIEYRAQTDKPTVVNLTNHAFFNLNGSGSILDHVLMVNANAFLPVDSTLIPTGEIRDVEETVFDFRGATTIGSRIGNEDQQLKFGKGYDHNYVLNKSRIIPSAMVKGDKSGIVMKVFTDQPGLQFYSGNFMKGENKLRSGADAFRTAFCLETQHFPDSPNQASFPSTVLRPGDVYHSRTVYAFSSDK
ncbi:galactose mutarotase [Pedobacter sp. KBS0701]|uniref:aldose epimerase family protein n=1 Tax=Pedobacter sp. KBS0701 TaxID=2578106 RepID=UPI00110D801D|nr:aldose epimerase family protein [Pedobacter sp. KBS0701]QDW27237.1 galactose mutarotase [Pedobacter sp. KBS0701]